MKSNINIKPLRTWSSIPKSWEARPNVINYDQATELHYEDGWRDVVNPVLLINQRLGGLYHDIINDVVTREVIDLTPEEIQQRELNRILEEAESRREEIIEETKRRQIIDTFQAIEDEAFEVKEVFPRYDPEFDYLTVQAGYKVTRILIEEDQPVLALFFLIQPHTPALGDSSFLPENAPALWSRVLIGEGGVEVWTQPIGGDGKYKWGAIVQHNNRKWRNDHDPANLQDPNSTAWLNVWEPGQFAGWTDLGAV